MAGVAVQVSITNLPRVRQMLRNYGGVAEGWYQRAIEASAAEVQKNATRAIVPWKTGRMVQSFGEGITFGRLFAKVGPTVEYAIFVDQGTKYIRPRYFMQKIVDKALPAIRRHFEEATARIVQSL